MTPCYVLTEGLTMENIVTLERKTINAESARAMMGVALVMNTQDAGQIIVVAENAAAIYDLLAADTVDPINRDALKDVAVIQRSDTKET